MKVEFVEFLISSLELKVFDSFSSTFFRERQFNYISRDFEMFNDKGTLTHAFSALRCILKELTACFAKEF